jgi:cytochrome P450 family 135
MRQMVGKLVQAARYTWRFHDLTGAQHRRHGASWTLRLPGLPDALVTTDRELIRHLLTGDPKVRRHANDILAPALGEGSVMLLEPEPHLARRRLLLPPFHGERVKGYADLMRRLVREDLAGWPDDGEVRVHERARTITLGVIQEAVLGSRDAAFARELAALMDAFDSPLANLGLFAPALSRRARWNLPAEHFHRRRDRLDALMAGQIAARRAGEPGDDILWMLLEARDEEGRGLSDSDLNDELKTLLSAGHETTATAIAWAADLLAHRPQAAQRIREGDRAYRSAAVKEVLRLRTVTPVSVARVLLEPHDGLSAGAQVLIDAHTLHHDPELWDEPEEFRPERFLGGGGPPQYAYLPFGGGAHRCIGAALATLELEVALEEMLAAFDLSPAGPPARPVRRGPTLVPSGGAAVRVVRRAAPQA